MSANGKPEATSFRGAQLFAWPIDEIKMTGGTREGGIEPVEIVGIDHIVGHVALVDIDICPLSALGLVASDGISEFHLQGVVVIILADVLHTLRL